MKTTIGLIGSIVMAVVLLSAFSAPAFSQCQGWLDINLNLNYLPYTVPRQGGSYWATAAAWGPVPEPCEIHWGYDTYADWIELGGDTEGSPISFDIDISSNNDVERSDGVWIEMWITTETFPKYFTLSGEEYFVVNQATGVPTWLTVDPEEILIPPNKTVTFQTDMIEFTADLKYRYNINYNDPWSEEYTTPSY